MTKKRIKSKTLVLILTLLALSLLLFFLMSKSKDTQIKLINSSAFENLIKNESVFVLNVHTPYYGEINGTDAIIEDWQNIALYKDKLPRDLNTPIAVYCRSGRMSASAAQQLKELGYKNIYDLEGGMNAWVESGRGIITR